MSTLERLGPCTMYVHKKTGQWASPFGAGPRPLEDWELKEVGFTSFWSDGTRGHGHKPFATMQEAQAWRDKLPASYQGRL